MMPTQRPGPRPPRARRAFPGLPPLLLLMMLGLPAYGRVMPAARAGGDDEAHRRDLALLQGIWTLESMEVDGEKAKDELTKGWILVIKGDLYNPGSGQTSVEYTFHIDPELNPKAIDLIPHDGSYKGRTLRGVYTIKADQLTICRTRNPDGERPAGFATRRDSGLVVTVWKRRKR